MAIVSILIFGAAMAASVCAIWFSIRPELARIIDLLAFGPVATATFAAPVPARSTLREVRVRPVSARRQQRAAA